MAVTISAVFDTVDMADFARARLRERGVEYADCEIEDLRKEADSGYAGTMTAIVNPFMPFAGMSLAESFATLPANMQRYGGVLMSRDDSDLADIAGDAGLDGMSESALSDVKMRLRVRNDQVELAEGILVSCHGTKVRRG